MHLCPQTHTHTHSWSHTRMRAHAHGYSPPLRSLPAQIKDLINASHPCICTASERSKDKRGLGVLKENLESEDLGSSPYPTTS